MAEFRSIVSRKVSRELDDLFQVWCDKQTPPLTREQGVVVILDGFLAPQKKELLKILKEKQEQLKEGQA